MATKLDGFMDMDYVCHGLVKIVGRTDSNRFLQETNATKPFMMPMSTLHLQHRQRQSLWGTIIKMTDEPKKELPPSDQPWGDDLTTVQEYMANVARIVFEYYNSLCESGLSKPEAIFLAQLFQTQYWAIVLNIIYRGKSKTND